MSCAERMRQLLRPLGVYDLEGAVNRAALEVKGEALDVEADFLELAERESDLTRAQGEGLERWRSLFSLLPASGEREELRQSVLALLRVGFGCCTLQAVESTLSGCGITTQVRENGSGKVQVSFPNVVGVPEEFEKLKANIEQILPAHVEVEYLVDYLTWEELEGYGWTFRDIRNTRWTMLERKVLE